MAYADDLFRDAQHLAKRGGKHPKQSSLQRAVSTAYYAAFHLLVADFVANWRIPEQRARLGRMFEHRRMSGAVFETGDKHNPTPIEVEIKSLIAKFTQLQKDRYEADYNVAKIWFHTDVVRALDLADEVFKIWRRVRKEKLAQHHLMSMFGARQN
ncbi:conserved hypothetical protein [Candidatus Sulfopaludibacter sp. SbA4]|nr:conserved hypothetical protein [Candidatus Sulfopaludibacter sp. SbA4]